MVLKKQLIITHITASVLIVLFACFKRIQQASGLLIIALITQVSTTIVRLLKNNFITVTRQVITPKYVTIAGGAMQGTTLSPTVFCVHIDGMLRVLSKLVYICYKAHLFRTLSMCW